MAIAYTPQNLFGSQGNAQVYLQWDIVAGATSYSIQRSLDGITFTSLSTSTAPNYTDTAVTIATQYYYQVASVNGSGTSPYCSPISVIPAPTAELSLGELRQRSQQRADRVNSNFVTTEEWNFFLNQSLYELYDLLITCYEDYFMAQPASFVSNGNQFLYPLPDGILNFTNISNQSFVAQPLYKLLGVDLAINNAANAYVTVNKFMFQDRNRFVYPNTASTIYGVFNLQYRMMGTNIEFIPTPSASQIIRLWYIPRLPQLLKDTDISTLGFSGWLQYVIIRAAKYALDKEEADTTQLTQEILFLKGRIEEAAQGRDAGMPDRITDVRQNGYWGAYSGGMGFSGPIGGF